MNNDIKNRQLSELAKLAHINLQLLHDLRTASWLEVVRSQIHQLTQDAIRIYQHNHGTSEAATITHFSRLAAGCNEHMVAQSLTHGEAIGLLSLCLEYCLSDEVQKLQPPAPESAPDAGPDPTVN